MRRRIWFRPLSALLALWLPLMLGEPRVLMPCPMHGVQELIAEMSAPQASHHDMAAMHHAGAQHGDHTSKGHHCCNCIDGCCTSAVLQPSRAEPIALTVIAYHEHGAVPSVESLARPAPEHARPYTTGPPRA